MTKPEKIIAAYNCGIDKAPDSRCEKCPYGYGYLDQTGDNYVVSCNTDMMFDDALELLKAQEPRMMTVDEVAALKRGEVVWYEQHTPDGDYIQPMVADGRGYIGNADLGVKLCYLGHCERLWTAEPTDEQREAVKWK